MARTILNSLQIGAQNDFMYPVDKKLSAEEIISAINYNRANLRPHYKKLMHMYLNKDTREHEPRQLGPDNHVHVAIAKYLVDTYNGYFAGIPPTFQLPDEKDNQALQNWINYSSLADKLSALSKQVDIYGRSYAFLYQNEESNTNFTIVTPTHGLMIYDDTVEKAPLCFIRYSYDTLKRLQCDVYYKDEVQTYINDQLTDTKVNVYKQVPAVEFCATDEKIGLFEPVFDTINQLNKVLSEKANQDEDFDNALLSIIGARFPRDPKTGETKVPNLKHNRLLFMNPIDNGVKPEIKYLAKPDADNIQEHLIKHYTDSIYNDTGIPNPYDENFGQNVSGIALQFKFNPMSNKAMSKERKFIQSLRKMFSILFNAGIIVSDNRADELNQMKFTFARNLPEDLKSEIEAAKEAEGLVSKKTQLSLLPFVSDPQAEIDQMDKEQRDQIHNVRLASGSLTDAEKADDE